MLEEGGGAVGGRLMVAAKYRALAYDAYTATVDRRIIVARLRNILIPPVARCYRAAVEKAITISALFPRPSTTHHGPPGADAPGSPKRFSQPSLTVTVFISV